MRVLIELIKYLVQQKKFWLLPSVIVVIVFGGLLVISQGSVVAPFIYTIF